MRILLLVSPLLVAAACGGGTGRPVGDSVEQLPTLRIVEGQVTYFLRGATIQANRDQDGRVIARGDFEPGTNPLEVRFQD